jgi:adenylate cyclase
MPVTNNEELVKRIARLAKQNQELEENIKKLEKVNEKLLYDFNKIKILYEKAVPEAIKEPAEGERRERSLKFNMATVLFADITGFSRVAEGIDSSAIMDELDEILIEFESIVTKYKIEKIKTIGDTYMCAGGIPVKNITNPVDVAMAALEMRTFLQKFELTQRRTENRRWDLKIGIHTGPVTAGISGRKN